MCDVDGCVKVTIAGVPGLLVGNCAGKSVGCEKNDGGDCVFLLLWLKNNSDKFGLRVWSVVECFLFVMDSFV